MTHHDLIPSGGSNNDARVVELIDWESKGWKMHLVRELFGVDNAAVISQIPIGFIHNSDMQIWS